MSDSSTGPESRQEFLIGLGVVAVVLGLLAAEGVTNYQPAKLVGLLFLVAWGPLIVLHEAGHAVAARVVGWHVSRVVIGFGKPIFRTECGGVPVEIRMFPIEGFVSTAPGDLRSPGLKHAWIYAAGPGIELLLAGLILWVVTPARLFAETAEIDVVVSQAVALAAVTGAVFNLIPHSAEVGGRLVPNDGLGILLSLTRPAGTYDSMLVSGNEPSDFDDGEGWKPPSSDRWR